MEEGKKTVNRLVALKDNKTNGLNATSFSDLVFDMSFGNS